MRIGLILIFVLAIAGCSTTQVQTGYETPVPVNHIYNRALLIANTGTEQVTFKRDKGFLGSACSHLLFIDNVKSFEIFPSESISINLEPGNHLFRLDTGRGSCPNETHSQATFLELGKPQIFRISISSNFNLMLTRIE